MIYLHRNSPAWIATKQWTNKRCITISCRNFNNSVNNISAFYDFIFYSRPAHVCANCGLFLNHRGLHTIVKQKRKKSPTMGDIKNRLCCTSPICSEAATGCTYDHFSTVLQCDSTPEAFHYLVRSKMAIDAFLMLLCRLRSSLSTQSL